MWNYDARLALLAGPEILNTPQKILPILENAETLEESLESLLQGAGAEGRQNLTEQERQAMMLAFFILAQSQRFETWRTLLKTLRLPDRELHHLFGRALEESVGLALASMALGDFNSLKSIVRDISLSRASRRAAFQALIIETERLPERRIEVIALLAELLEFHAQESAPENLWGVFMESLALFPVEIADDLRDAVLAGTLPESGPRGGLEKFVASLAHSRKSWWHGRIPFNLFDEIQRWATFV